MYAFTTPKAGQGPETNEDMVCTSAFYSESGQLVQRVVVLDGKTMACNSRYFTREAAFDLAAHDGFDRAAESGARAWDAYMEGRELPTHWAVPGQLARGPACTVLTATTRSDGLLRIQAIGDCCLFITREGELLHSFPLKSSKDFAPVPAELAPLNTNGKKNTPRSYRGSGRFCSCIELFAMTDELARYVFAQLEQGKPPFRDLRVKNTEQFLELVAKARQAGGNDDMTLAWWTPSQ